MNRGWFLLCLFPCLLPRISGQTRLFDPVEVELSFKIVADSTNVSVIDNGQRDLNSFIPNYSLRMEGADLVLSFETSKKLRDHEYFVSISAINSQGVTFYVRPGFGEDELHVPAGEKGHFVWRSFIENRIVPGQNWVLVLSISLYGSLPKRPLENPLAKQLYGGAVVTGFGMGIFALLELRSSKKSADRYRDLWKANRLELEARQELEKARDKESSFRTWGLIGGGLLLGTAAMYLNSWHIYRRDLKRLNPNVEPVRLSLSPSLGTGLTQSAVLGVSLKLQFE